MGNLIFTNWCCKKCSNSQLIFIPQENGIYDVKCDSCSQVYEITYIERLKPTSTDHLSNSGSDGPTTKIEIPEPFDNKGGILKGPK